MKVIKRTYDVLLARMMVDFLKRNGIDAVLLDAETTVMIPVTRGARVCVPDEDEAQAHRLLAELEQLREEDENEPS